MEPWPSASDLRNNYERINWHYGDNPRPFWVIHQNQVYRFLTLNGGPASFSAINLKSETNTPKSPSVVSCEAFFLNKLRSDAPPKKSLPFNEANTEISSLSTKQTEAPNQTIPELQLEIT